MNKFGSNKKIHLNTDRDEMVSSIFVVIPTYNEASNLSALITQLFTLPGLNLEVVIVDDNSPDGTGELAEELRHNFLGRIHVVHRTGKLGLGSAYRHGFDLALKLGAKYIVQMDADFSHSPSYLPTLIQKARHYDVVVGSRYVQGGMLDPKWSILRFALSKWANSIYIRLILKLKVRDATGGFKCWNRRALKAVLKHPVKSSGYIFQVEMAYLAEKLGLSVLEVPIYFEDRQTGKSKMSADIKLEAIWRTWQLRWRYRNLRLVKTFREEENPRLSSGKLASLRVESRVHDSIRKQR
jgi:dolichol-phosphate mannosyltransferase